MYKVLSTKYKVEIRSTAFLNHKNLVSLRIVTFLASRLLFLSNVQCRVMKEEVGIRSKI
jgi:hypothetical protein